MPEGYTELGSRMKAYEAATGNVLPRYLPYIVRVDGRAFHSLLRNANKPFDMQFVRHMGHVAEYLCREIQGAVFAYAQSDEISVLVCSYSDYTEQPWFGGRVQKIASVAAGMASAQLAVGRHISGLVGQCCFDGRAFALPNVVEVANYFVWRQRDCERNAVSMAAQAYFSPQQLHGKTREERIEMLRRRDMNFGGFPGSARLGQACTKVADQWMTAPAERFAAAPGSWLAERIPPMPSFEENDAPDPAAVQRAVREHFPAEVLRDLARKAAEDG